MTAKVWNEVQLAVGGALMLARGDPRGLGFFDVSVAGFWRSFRAGAICYPFYLILLGFRLPQNLWTDVGPVRILLVETIGYVISWVAYPLLVLPLARWMGRESRYFAYMVAYNWSQLPQTALFVAVGGDAAGGLLPAGIMPLLNLAAAVAVLVYEWYIARVALAVSSQQAIPFVLADVLLGTLLSRITSALY